MKYSDLELDVPFEATEAQQQAGEEFKTQIEQFKVALDCDAALLVQAVVQCLVDVVMDDLTPDDFEYHFNEAMSLCAGYEGDGEVDLVNFEGTKH